ncbi:CdaR family protein [Enterococcus sp. AZ109]|uniref:CdaR family protein n=1 Tax=Enterococcus sp. AZ109 TaxID=2774634 RepID=UPI003F20F46D
MMIKFKKSNLPYLLISLLFSLMLFFNVNSQNVSDFFSSNSTYQEVLQNVPITLEYDSDEYFVHGFDNTVSVRLSSANRIQLDREADEDTRTFSIVADLNDLDTGTHVVKLQTRKLLSSIYAAIEPQTISVTIEKKQTKTFDVIPVISNGAEENGLQVDSLTSDPSTVEITTGEQTMSQISQVIASVDASQLTGEDDTVRTQILALNTNGEALPIQADPQTVTVSFRAEQDTKQVALEPKQEGTIPSSVQRFDIELDQTNATIRGLNSVIDAIDTIEVPVNITNITEPVSRRVDIPIDEGISVNPIATTARITPILRSSASSSSAESSSRISQNTSSMESEGATSSNTEQTGTSSESTITSTN